MEQRNNAQLECIITDLNLITPTKQFKNSRKETYNCKLVLSKDNKQQMDDLTTAINNAKNEGLKNEFKSVDYPNGLIYPTKYEKDCIIMVTCTFFKPNITDLNGNDISFDKLQQIEKKGKFHGVVDVSFYPYARGTTYGVGTNLNAIKYIDDVPEDPNQPPHYTIDDVNPFDDMKKEKEQQNMNNQSKIESIKNITITKTINGIDTTFSFDLLSESKPNIFIIVQEKKKPTVYNVGLYDETLFDYATLNRIIEQIINNNNDGSIWNNSALCKSEISQMYNYTIGTISKMV